MTPIPDRIRTQLLEDETVIWWGRPRQGIFLRSRDWLLIPFSLLWGGFAIFWEGTVLASHAPLPFALFGVPFVLVGLFMIVGRFRFDAWLRQRTDYAVTDRRALIARGPPWASFKAVNLDRLPETTFEEQSAGRGTIVFGAPVSLFGNRNGQGFGVWIPALDPTPRFLDIDDVQRVYAEVQTRSQSRRPPG